MKKLVTTLKQWTNGTGYASDEILATEIVSDDFDIANDSENLDETYIASGNDDAMVVLTLYSEDGEVEDEAHYWIIGE